jgi:hypothetical protein
MSSPPWESHPALTADRLQAVAHVIAEVRHNAVDAHEDDRGDTSWGLGCRSHERTMYAISTLAGTPGFEWLSVVEPGLHFVFAIGGVPIRFYRGEADHPPTRSLRRNYPEIQASQLSFDAPGIHVVKATKHMWRLAIETDADGRVFRIVAVAVSDDGAISSTWDVPLTSPVRVVVDAGTPPREARELPPPVVKLKAPKVRKAEDDASE